jgi:hypothetical protein
VCPCCPLASVLSCAELARGNVTVTAVKYWTFFESRLTTAPKDRTTPVFGSCPCDHRPSTTPGGRATSLTPLSHLCVTLKRTPLRKPRVTCLCDSERTIHLCARDPWRTRWQVLSDFLSRGLIYFEPIALQVVIFCLVLLSHYF